MTVRRQYAGAASAQTLTAPMTSITGAATISGSTGWPSGSTGPFSVVVDRGTATEEKMLCLSVAGTALTIQQRGYDGTSAYAHSSSATVEVCATSVDFDEANAHTSAAVGVHGLTGAVVGTTDTQTLSGKTLVQPTITDYTNAQHTHASAAQGGTAGFVTAPSQTLRAHFGTASLTPGGTTVAFPHGAPFTPVTGFISGTANVAFTSIVITSYDASNVGVAFYGAGSNSPLSIGTCNLSYVVFG